LKDLHVNAFLEQREGKILEGVFSLSLDEACHSNMSVLSSTVSCYSSIEM
jgi:hypothetical protein